METKKNPQKKTNYKQNRRRRLGKKISTTNEKNLSLKKRERETKDGDLRIAHLVIYSRKWIRLGNGVLIELLKYECESNARPIIEIIKTPSISTNHSQEKTTKRNSKSKSSTIPNL